MVFGSSSTIPISGVNLIMTRNRNRPARDQLQRGSALPPAKAEDQQAVTPELVLPIPGQGKLITAQIVQILLEKNNPDEVERLMKAELEYNEKRFAILREHSLKDPDSIEERQTSKFRRSQYTALLILLPPLLIALPFVPLVIGAAFSIICILIVCGVLLNGRERELDLSGFVKLFTAIVSKEQ